MKKIKITAALCICFTMLMCSLTWGEQSSRQIWRDIDKVCVDGEIYYLCNNSNEEENTYSFAVCDERGRVLWSEPNGRLIVTNDCERFVCDYNDNTAAVFNIKGERLTSVMNGAVSVTDDYNRYINYSYTDEKYAVVDKTGKEITEHKYNYITKVEGRELYITSIGEDENKRYGIIDNTDKILTPFEYDFILSNVTDEFLAAKEEKFCLLDKWGNNLCDAKYEDYISLEDKFYLCNGNDYYCVQNGEFKLYKTIMDYYLQPNKNFIRYSTAEPGSEGAKYGIMDKDLNLVTEPEWDMLYNMYGYALIVNGDDLCGVLDKNGKMCVQPVYEEIQPVEMGEEFNGKLICIKDGREKYISLVPYKEPDCDSWATGYIKYADWHTLVPEEFNGSFKGNITREEFCTLAMRLFLSGEYFSDPEQFADIKEFNLWDNPFKDTDNIYVVLANKLGIVSGRSESIFAPNDSITRQEAAVMLTRLAKTIRLDDRRAVSAEFADKGSFAPWASDSIAYISALRNSRGDAVMVGTGQGCFSPESSYSRQQAVATVARIYNIKTGILY